eukprot:scaffold314432_cov19-Tisochrysis_lutea.AAC.1
MSNHWLYRAPVYRGLYAEKKVIAEERRLRVDDAPLGKPFALKNGHTRGDRITRPALSVNT